MSIKRVMLRPMTRFAKITTEKLEEARFVVGTGSFTEVTIIKPKPERSPTATRIEAEYPSWQSSAHQFSS
jgi:hypothetical protein